MSRIIARSFVLLFVIIFGAGTLVRSSKSVNIDDHSLKTDIAIRQNRQWTFMVYLDGDNDLESAAIDDFLEMSSVGTSQNVAIVALFDRWNGTGSYYDDTSYGDWTDTNLFNITSGLTPYASNALENWGEKNMGDPQTLVDFVLYCVDNFTADHFALILWDHGGGYFGACWDEDNGEDNLELSEIRWALEKIYNDTGIKIDLLGFDACLMGDIEVAYCLRDYVDYVVFSQEYEPGDGWPYDDILSSLDSDPFMSASSLASIIVDKYINYYDLYNVENATMSAVNVSYIVRYTYAAINSVAGYLLRYYNTYESDIIYAMNNAELFYYEWQKDLKHFFTILRNRVSDSKLISLLDEAISELENAVIDYGHLSLHPNAYGLSAYIYDQYFSTYYGFDSSLHHQWDEFQKRMAGASPGIWFYDIKFYGLDYDGDGLFGNNLTVYVDLDDMFSIQAYVKIYGTNGTDEVLAGESENFTISGATSGDAMNITISLSDASFNTFRVEIYNMSDYLIKQFYYYCDDNISNVPIEIGEPPIDLVAPTIEITSPPNNSYVGGTFDIYWDYSDNIKVDHIEIKTDDEQWQNIGLVKSYTLSGLTSGKHTIYVKAVDTAGLEDTAYVVLFVDAKAPSLQILSPSNNTYIGVSTILIEWEANDSNLDHLELYINDTLIDDNILSSQSNYSLDLMDGTYMIRLVAYDSFGNENHSSIVVTIDTQPPELEILSPTNNTNISEASVDIALNISDNIGVQTIYVYVNGSLYQTLNGSTENFTISFDESGLYNITIIAEDYAGNKDIEYLLISVNIETTTQHTGGGQIAPWSINQQTMIGFSVIAILVIITLLIIVSKRKSSYY